ncbi:MAG: hypothetical protein GWN16_13745 [Calditrichae bacterium]|nr:hypothetical protein [Calditrichia bacterium]
MNTLDIGLACLELGAGRLRAEDTVDAQSGIRMFKKIGDKVSSGDDLLEIRTNNACSIPQVLKKLKQAITIKDSPVNGPILIVKEFSEEIG